MRIIIQEVKTIWNNEKNCEVDAKQNKTMLLFFKNETLPKLYKKKAPKKGREKQTLFLLIY